MLLDVLSSLDRPFVGAHAAVPDDEKSDAVADLQFPEYLDRVAISKTHVGLGLPGLHGAPWAASFGVWLRYWARELSACAARSRQPGALRRRVCRICVVWSASG